MTNNEFKELHIYSKRCPCIAIQFIAENDIPNIDKFFNKYVNSHVVLEKEDNENFLRIYPLEFGIVDKNNMIPLPEYGYVVVDEFGDFYIETEIGLHDKYEFKDGSSILINNPMVKELLSLRGESQSDDSIEYR